MHIIKIREIEKIKIQHETDPKRFLHSTGVLLAEVRIHGGKKSRTELESLIKRHTQKQNAEKLREAALKRLSTIPNNKDLATKLENFLGKLMDIGHASEPNDKRWLGIDDQIKKDQNKVKDTEEEIPPEKNPLKELCLKDPEGFVKTVEALRDSLRSAAPNSNALREAIQNFQTAPSPRRGNLLCQTLELIKALTLAKLDSISPETNFPNVTVFSFLDSLSKIGNDEAKYQKEVRKSPDTHHRRDHRSAFARYASLILKDKGIIDRPLGANISLNNLYKQNPYRINSLTRDLMIALRNNRTERCSAEALRGIIEKTLTTANDDSLILHLKADLLSKLNRMVSRPSDTPIEERFLNLLGRIRGKYNSSGNITPHYPTVGNLREIIGDPEVNGGNHPSIKDEYKAYNPDDLTGDTDITRGSLGRYKELDFNP